METDYTYDTLNNLINVNQTGGTGSSGARTRAFSYDSLSRLITATNPETGTVCYGVWSGLNCVNGYDLNGNLLTKTDARSIQASYKYDTLNRLYAKNYLYANGTSTGDPSACMQYDVAASGGSDANPVGAMTLEWTAPAGTCPSTSNSVSSIPGSAYNSTAVLSHDAMGRTLLEQQCPYGSSCGSSYRFSYLYDLAGATRQFNNGITVGNGTVLPAITWGTTLNSAGQLQAFNVLQQPWNTPGNPDPSHPATLIQALASGTTSPYDALGHLVNAQLALDASNSPAAINVVRQYDNRGRIVSETDGYLGMTGVAGGGASTISFTGNEAGPLTSGGTPGTGTLTVTGADGGHQVCTVVWVPEGPYHVLTPVNTNCNYVADTGILSVTIDGFTASVSYGLGSTDAALASQLAAGLNMSGSPVTASASGSAIIVTAIATGPSSNYPVSISSGDFTVSDLYSTLTGGQGGGTPVYDAGTASATITGNGGSWTATANWRQGSTANSLASSLASAINAVGGIPVTASASGSTVNLSGTGASYSVSVDRKSVV